MASSDGTSLPGAPASGQSSFTQKILEITVTLSANQKTNQPIKFAGTDSNTATFSGFRTSVRIENSGAPAGSRASIRIWGMSQSVMNQLSTLGQMFNSIQKNTVTVSAGDTVSGVSPVFSGTVNFAYPAYNEAPIVPLIMECQTGLINGVLPVAASSYPQPTDVATIMASIATQMNVSFENNGVTVQLPPSYFSGSLLTQMREVAEHAHINAELVAGPKLAIWPIGGSRTSLQGQNLPLISKETGMIGYPSFAPNAYMIVRTIFNRQIAFGGAAQVQSIIPQSNRTWTVQRLDHALDSLFPKGKWESTCYCYPQGFPAPPPMAAAT